MASFSPLPALFSPNFISSTRGYKLARLKTLLLLLLRQKHGNLITNGKSVSIRANQSATTAALRNFGYIDGGDEWGDLPVDKRATTFTRVNRKILNGNSYFLNTEGNIGCSIKSHFRFINLCWDRKDSIIIPGLLSSVV